MAPNAVEMQPQSSGAQMIASRENQEPTDAATIAQKQGLSDVEAQQQKPRLQMRGGGLILDLCACFICCEICKDCCEAIDDCCCC